MSVQLSARKAESTPALAAFVGVLGEIIADTISNRLVLQDGATAGGWPAAKLAEVLTNGNADGITAHAGGGQGSATPLTKTINRITVVTTAADSAMLSPSSATNVLQVVINGGANALQLFGSGSDTINGAAFGTGISLAAGKIGIYFSPAPGVWVGGVLS